jgi:hypothetical protein
MGEVREAWDILLCRSVALKILKNLEPDAMIRFMHEAQVHARLVHPNICRVYDVENFGGTLHFALTGQPPPSPLPVPRPQAPDLPALPRDLRLIIVKCLEPDPARRHPSAAAFADDLERYLEDGPFRFRESGWLARLVHQASGGLFQARRWLPPLMVAVALAAVLGIRQDHRLRRLRQQAQQAETMALRASALERKVLPERMMAVHDFRPTYDLVREQLERDRASTRQLDPPWNSRGHYAVGCGAFLLHDYTMALGYGGRNQALLRRSLVQQVQPGLN